MRSMVAVEEETIWHKSVRNERREGLVDGTEELDERATCRVMCLEGRWFEQGLQRRAADRRRCGSVVVECVDKQRAGDMPALRVFDGRVVLG